MKYTASCPEVGPHSPAWCTVKIIVVVPVVTQCACIIPAATKPLADALISSAWQAVVARPVGPQAAQAKDAVVTIKSTPNQDQNY